MKVADENREQSWDDTDQGVTLPQVAAMMAESQYWSHRQMQDYQRLQLSQLLVHAKTTTQFYKNRLDVLFNIHGSLDWARWHEVPILKRADLQQRRNEMLSSMVPQSHGRVGTATSSGSTGIPVSVDAPQLAVSVASTAWVRFYKTHGIDLNRGMTEFKAFLPNGKPMTADVLNFAATDKSVPRTWINRNSSAAQKLQCLQEQKSIYLADTTNHLEVLAHENLRLQNPVRLEAVIGIGMKISAEQEKLISSSFQARTLSPYSSKEGTLMAFQCAAVRGNFHICSELSLLEVLDDAGKPVEIGQPGRVVVTPFFNSAQPLIRYEQGDIVVRGPPCSCGITLPVLSEIRGRSDAIFHFPDKKIAATRFDDTMIQHALVADAFQFAQIAPLEIVVRYVSAQDASEKGKAEVRQHLLGIVQTDADVSFVRMDSIPFNSGGKQQRVTREF